MSQARAAAVQTSAGEGQRQWWRAALVAALALAAGWVCVAGNWGSDFWWNDAARHAMDGVFVLDFIRDLPASLRVYQYATEYYARYPCLGLVHYPPFFPAVEALFFAVLGVGMPAARLTVAAFAALGAVFGYLVAARFLGPWGAALAVLLLITAPEAVFWSREVMLETPTMAMMLVASHYFLRYVDDERRGAGVAAAVLLVLAVLTKQTACCLVPAWVAYAVWRRGWRILWRGETLLAGAVAALLLAPFAVATLLFARLNVAQSVGSVTGGYAHSRWSLQGIVLYLTHIPRHAGLMGLVGIALLAVGLVAGRAVRPAGSRSTLLSGPVSRAGVVFALLWVGVCYVFFTFVIANRNSRLVLLWAPGLALMGAAGFTWLRGCGRLGRGASWLAAVAVGVQTLVCILGLRHDPWAWPAPRVSGTAAAAERLVGAPPGTVVFYSGRHNGSFIFHLRRLDPGRHLVVLRDSKLLYSMPAMVQYGVYVHAADRKDILKVLQDYGVRYLLLEDLVPRSRPVRQIMEEVSAVVSSTGFVHRGEFPVRATHEHLPCTLHLYEVLEARPARAEVLTLDLPLSGRTIRVPLRRLGVPTAPPEGPPGKEG